MPFVKADPNINRKGRALGTSNKAMSKRDIKERELMSLLRKVKPHMSAAIGTAVGVMGNREATHMNQLKASLMILNFYKTLMDDMYDAGDVTEEGEEIQPAAPVFSLRMINNDVPAEE